MQYSAVALFGRYRMARAGFGHVMVVTLMRGDLAAPAALIVGFQYPYANGTLWTGTWNAYDAPNLVSAHMLISR